MPSQKIDYQFDKLPSFQDAEDKWNQMRDGYQYSSDQPFDKRLNQVKEMGHGIGSSSLANIGQKKDMARRREDLENSLMIHDALLKDHQAKGRNIDYLGNLNDYAAKARENPIRFQQDTLREGLNQSNMDRYRNAVFNKDIAQMQNEDADKRIRENAASYDMDIDAINREQQWINQGSDPDLPPSADSDSRPVPLALRNAKHIQVLCTGSLHLVGGILGVLDPNLNSHGAE